MKEKLLSKKILPVLLCVILIAGSVCFGTFIASKPNTYKKTIAELDEKSADVAKMSVATLGMSTLIAAVPVIVHYIKLEKRAWLLFSSVIFRK